MWLWFFGVGRDGTLCSCCFEFPSLCFEPLRPLWFVWLLALPRSFPRSRGKVYFMNGCVVPVDSEEIVAAMSSNSLRYAITIVPKIHVSGFGVNLIALFNPEGKESTFSI